MAFFPRGHGWQQYVAATWLLLLSSSGATLGQSLDERLLADAKDGRLDRLDFCAAALFASGVHEPAELDAWRQRYTALRREVIAESASATSAKMRLAMIHAAMHERILVGNYQTAATDLRGTISMGDFNCLSAVAIYFDLCHAAGLELEMWLLPGHVWLRSPDPAIGKIDPASREWSFAVRRDGAGADGNARRITPVQLLGKFYYNRGVEHLQRRQFAAGLALLRTSLALDPNDADARENLAAGLNNWAVEHCRAERYQAAAELIQQGLTLAPAFGPLVANERLVRGKLQASADISAVR